MNLQQLRYFQEVVRQELNVSRAAATLYTSQPGVSKQLKQLEEELGVDLFVRRGKRLVCLTEAGQQVSSIVARILEELRNLRRLAEDQAGATSGTLDIATTHTQARYTLPPVVKRFMTAYPGVRLCLHQGNPPQVAQWVAEGIADLGIATEALADHPELVTLPCFQWSHLVIAPQGHELCREGPLTLSRLAEWPLITYDPSFTGRTNLDQTFSRAGVTPNIVLTAVDSDVIKTYVELGLGLGIIAEMAFDPLRDTTLAAIAGSQNLFGTNTTRLAFRRGIWLRRFDYAFIETFAPQLTRRVIERALVSAMEIDPIL